MGYSIKRKKIELDECFPEDVEQYYEIAEQYLNLTTEDFASAFEISKKAWVLSDRWSALASDAGKLATMKKLNKTDIKDYCYRKYKQMSRIHEHTRMIWNKGELAVREKRL